MKLTVSRLLIAIAITGVLSISGVQAANTHPTKQVISNPFHEYSGIPGLKLGYGDVLAQCQAYDNTNNANPYLPFVSNVNVIVNDNYNVGAGVNQGCRAPQNETTIAVNPANPNNLVAGANDYRDCCVVSGTSLRNDGSGWVYVSTDGGLTWANKKLPGLGSTGDPRGVFKKLTSVGDPTIAFGANNTVYYANIGFNRVDESDGIFVSVSHNGGTDWDYPVLVANSGGATFFNDKLWVGADPNSGKVTISWTRFKDNPQYGYVESPIVAATSSNYGASWSNWVDVSGPHKYNQGSVPVYGNDGNIYVSFESAVAANGYLDYNVVAKSTNGGQSFSQTVVSRNVDENFPIFGGRGVLTGLHFRTNTFAALTVDRVTGKLWMAWADNRNGDATMFCDPAYGGSGCAPTSAQVFIQSSTDGVTWTAPQQLTSTAQDKIYPWVAANAGNVIVSYYSREWAPAGEIDFAYVKSANGGTTWSASTRITEQSSDPSIQFASGAFIGDYTGVAIGSDNVAHPIWTDFRGKPGVTSPNQDAVTKRIALP
ncbi:MAG: exo-alpha-sialidase [Chloroflexi bacterium]|nr:exo-alpha-sialidase [Chloroflexota bacterium]